MFTKNCDRLMAGDIAAKFAAAVLNPPRVRALLSNDHISVDGTLIDAWASMKSFKPKDGVSAKSRGRNAQRDFRKEKRSLT